MQDDHQVPSAVAPPSTFRAEWRVIDACPDPLDVFDALFGESRNAFLLESSVVRDGFSRFSFVGDAHAPGAEAFRYDLATRRVEVETDAGTSSCTVPNFFDFLAGRIDAVRIDGADELPFGFDGGYVGYLGYELKAEAGSGCAHASDEPAAVFMFAGRLVAIDHVAHRTYLLHLVPPDADAARPASSAEARLANDWLAAAESAVRRPAHAVSAAAAAPRRARMSIEAVEAWIGKHARIRHPRVRYIQRIRDALKEIVDGETYEVCLTNSIEFVPDFPPLELYRVLRRCSPAPHAGFFRAGDFHLLSASPERFISVNRDRYVEAKPIKGTRPRGATPDEDRRQIEDLLGSEKDRAENLMIVDLLRNDLGRVCELSTVDVPRLFDIETYSHVHQLVSTISGKLKRGVSSVECVRAAFPGGSMTGAPKLRTMEIIDRLEAGPRGVYSGAFGWFGLSGACDLNIVIRSLVVLPGKARFGVGGALTALSDPEEEFVETMVKARNLIEAIESLKAAGA
ncbi:aminodeoxychorismate synthase component I [Burkholderia multivorans]|uniref:aminodeoxychorismate synthase component I n=2 Tax=Burkholderia multivorans TaxID=87883 RepID=UPI001B91F9BF|nr:aminodeoxychorismate synthase component I [Burkholderia multivorans]MBR8017323.1 aminodeoxychorismate synthase component I [Burkholderia multivorans]MEB2512696.1 aminodeoxychorismate synthase component I [Burkholderia multivorans]MEB2576824.1 aminodeoxychorismate synthase component I [Burkholderia multivorans]HEF4729068.1 aminodeoxychorismate synthase component I [Burkholderia multivorans]